jgi:hypothetical protein
MHFLRADERHRPLVETAFAYHDIALWTDRELAYLEPSEVLALQDNATEAWGLDPDLLQDAIHWHHKITPYRGPGAEVVNAIRKADWIDASGGLLRQGLSRELSREQVAAVEAAIVRRHDLLRALERQQRAGVAHVEVAGHQHLLHRRGQVEQAQQVAGGAARAAHGLRGLLVREPNSSTRRCRPCASSSGLRSSRWMFSISAITAAASSGTSRTSTGTSVSPASGRRGSGVRRR